MATRLRDQWTFGYARDALGQLASASDPLENLQHSYGYDTLNRLTGDQRSTGSANWSYDAANELTQVADTTIPSTSTLSYDAAAELPRFRSMADSTPTQDLTLGYNANGDRTGQTDDVQLRPVWQPDGPSWHGHQHWQSEIATGGWRCVQC